MRCIEKIDLNYGKFYYKNNYINVIEKQITQLFEELNIFLGEFHVFIIKLSLPKKSLLTTIFLVFFIISLFILKIKEEINLLKSF